MKRKILSSLLAAAIAACCVAPAASAQSSIQRIGIINSLKDMGLTVQTGEKGSSSFNSLSLLVDMEGILMGKAPYPGAKMYWNREEVAHVAEHEDYRCTFYFGGGVGFGFVRDYSRVGHKNPGFMTGMLADAGILLTFRGDIDIAFDWTAEVGFHLRRDETYYSKYDLSWYANGLIKAWLPCVTVFYRF